MHGTRIQLTVDAQALGHTHHAGDHGTITKHNTDTGLLIVHMDDGRPQFLYRHEVTVLPGKPTALDIILLASLLAVAARLSFELAAGHATALRLAFAGVALLSMLAFAVGHGTTSRFLHALKARTRKARTTQAA